MKKIITITTIALASVLAFAQEQTQAELSSWDKFANQTLEYTDQLNLSLEYNFGNAWVYRGIQMSDWTNQLSLNFKTDVLEVVDVYGGVFSNLAFDGNFTTITDVGISKDFVVYDTIQITPMAGYRAYIYSNDISDSNEFYVGAMIDPDLYGIKFGAFVARDVNTLDEGIEGIIYREFALSEFDVDIPLTVTPYFEAGIFDSHSWTTVGLQASYIAYSYKNIDIIPQAGVAWSWNDKKELSNPIAFTIGLGVQF